MDVCTLIINTVVASIACFNPDPECRLISHTKYCIPPAVTACGQDMARYDCVRPDGTKYTRGVAPNG